MNIEKKKTKKTKKTKKQTGGLINNLSPLATIFKIGKNEPPNTIRKLSNNILWKQKRLDFITEIKNLLLSKEYQKNVVPVFYGNNSDKKNGYISYIGYNEYICRTILGRLGVISSKRRIYIINPFAEFVYRITIFCIANSYTNKIDELQKLLKKLLKINDKFKGFPEIVYLPSGTRFCIVKNKDGLEKVITSQNNNYSRCSLVSGCSLMMSAEIREENLPSEEDIIELYNILGIDYKLWEFYHLSKNKTKYNNINKEHKLLQNKYFEGIIMLLLKLNNLKNQIIQLKEAYNNYINRIKANNNKSTVVINKILIHQEEVRQSIILSHLRKILNISNSNIPELEELYKYVKLQLQQPNVNLLEVSTKLIQEIITLLDSNKAQFLLFLETKPIEKLTILQILELN
jgi:hypothetical protein